MVGKFDDDPAQLLVVGVGDGADEPVVGSRWKLEDALASAAVYRTGLPARLDHPRGAADPDLAAILERIRPVATVAVPIKVGGRLWGAMIISTLSEPLPADTDERLQSFTDLIATALANAEARGKWSGSPRSRRRCAAWRCSSPSSRPERGLHGRHAGGRAAARCRRRGLARLPRRRHSDDDRQLEQRRPDAADRTQYPLDDDGLAAASSRPALPRELTATPRRRVRQRLSHEVGAWRSASGRRSSSRGSSGARCWPRRAPSNHGPGTPRHVSPRSQSWLRPRSPTPSRARRLPSSPTSRRRCDASRHWSHKAHRLKISSRPSRRRSAACYLSQAPRWVATNRTAASPRWPRGGPTRTPFLPAGDGRPRARTSRGWCSRPGGPPGSTTTQAATDPIGVAAREAGIKSGVGSPIVVKGHLWGVMTATSNEGPMSPDTEARLASFTRARRDGDRERGKLGRRSPRRARGSSTASDDARRRIVRDLHDGAQQRLVSHGVIMLKLAAAGARRRERQNGPDQLVHARRSGTQTQVDGRGCSEISPTESMPSVLATRRPARGRRGAGLAGLPVPVEVDDPAGRACPQRRSRSAAYFVVVRGAHQRRQARRTPRVPTARSRGSRTATLLWSRCATTASAAPARTAAASKASGTGSPRSTGASGSRARRRRDTGHGNHPHRRRRDRAIGATGARPSLRASA